MPYTVNGYINGVSYQATVGGEVLDPRTGVITGSPNVVNLLLSNEGDSFSTTVTGENVALDLQDPDSVLPALQSLTEVTSVEGDVPQTEEDFDPRAVY